MSAEPTAATVQSPHVSRFMTIESIARVIAQAYRYVPGYAATFVAETNAAGWDITIQMPDGHGEIIEHAVLTRTELSVAMSMARQMEQGSYA